jgi:phosphoglycerate dehydrogenase-like enzyme
VRVLIHNDETESLIEIVRARFPDVEVSGCESYAALPAALESFAPEVVYGIRFEPAGFPREAVLACAALKWMSVGGVGIDHLAPWDPERLSVTNGAGATSEVMASYVVGAILALTLRFPHYFRLQAAHRWEAGEVGVVAGRTLTVVGLGHVGREVARLAAAIGLRVVGTRAHPRPTPHVERVHGPGELHPALAEGDYVALCVPRLAATRGLIDSAAIAAMKDGAMLVDVSRGGVAESAALIAALRSGKLGGAALDVFETEPLPADSPFWDLENVIVTPHSCAVYPGWERSSVEMFCDNLARWMAGEPLHNLVDPARGY